MLRVEGDYTVRYGFRPVARPEIMMEIVKPDPYAVGARGTSGSAD